MATRTLTVKLVGDASQLNRTLGTTGSKFKGFAQKAAIGGAAIAGGIAVAWKLTEPLITAASDLNEEISKSKEIFGPAAAGLGAWAEAADVALGMSERAALAMASGFGQFGKAAGLEGEPLAAFATDLAGLASDLASFNNISTDEAALKLLSGLAGEAEPLRQLGVFLSADAVNAQALAMGLGDATGKLTEQEKVLARQALIFQQTSDAQGDFARTSDGLANQQRIMAAQWENVQAELGEKLLPMMLKVVTFINDDLIPAISDISNWLEEKVPAALEATRKFWEPIWDLLEAKVKTVFEAISLIVNIFQGDWGEAWGNIKAIFGNAWDEIKATFELAWATITTLFDGVLEWFKNLGASIAKAVGHLGMLLWDVGMDILEGLLQGLKDGWGAVESWVKGKVGWIKDAWDTVWIFGSPSRTAMEMGENITRGLGIGLETGFEAGVQPAVGAVSDGMMAGFGSPTVGASRHGGGMAPVVVVLEVDGIELARQVAHGSERAGGLPFKVRAAG